MRSTVFTALLLTAMTACSGQLQPVDASDDDGGEETMPLYVAEAFGRACGTSACHGGTVSPSLTTDTAPGIVGADAAAGGLPLVVLGDLQASYIAIKMLDDSLVDGSLRVGDAMPPPGQTVDPADLTIILGWIATTAPTAGDAGSGDESSGGGAVCGDGVIDEGEACDGTELGDATCISEGFADGTIACASDCTLDVSACTCAEVPADLSHASDIEPLWASSCALTGCHVPDATAPDLQTDAYTTLTEEGSTVLAGADWVVPSDPDQSYVFLKIAGRQAELGGGGGQMPYPPGVLTACEAELIEGWITQGALP